MRGIDFSHKITPRNVIFFKNIEKCFFVGDPVAINYPPLRASQGEKLAIFQIWREEEEVLSHLDNSSAHAPIG